MKAVCNNDPLKFLFLICRIRQFRHFFNTGKVERIGQSLASVFISARGVLCDGSLEV
jgi:hypothetical protein